MVPRRDAQLRVARARAPRPRGRRDRRRRPIPVARPGGPDARTSCGTPSRVAGPGSSAPASDVGTASPRSCRRSPRPSSRSWPRRHWAPHGRRVRRSSGRGPSSTASGRSSRSCCSPWTAIATATVTSTARRRSRSSARRSRPSGRRSSSPTCATRRAPSGRCRARSRGRSALGKRAARLRAGPVRPPVVRPLLIGDDRAPEGHRPRPRRDPPRALEGARAPHRPRADGPLLLVHDDRLDDVELPRLGAARGLDRRPVRREPRLARPLDAVAPGLRRARHVPRPECAVPHGLPGRGADARRDPTLDLGACGASGRRAPRCPRQGSGGSATPCRTPSRSARCRAGRTCARVSSGRRRSSRSGPARSAAGCSAQRWRRSIPTAGRSSRAGARDHRADALDAGRLLGRRRRLADARRPTSTRSPAPGVTATG